MGDPEQASRPTGPAARARGAVASVRGVLPGVAIAAILAIAATFLGRHYGGATMLFAVLLGLAVNFLADDRRCAAGLAFVSRTVLQTGVALLGARITADQIAAIGGAAAAGVLLLVVATLCFGLLLGRMLRKGAAFGVLTGGSVAICGASAALALSAALPRGRVSERETAFVVLAVTALGTTALILYPAIAGLLDLGADATGLFLGASIHDVAQAVGAGYSVSDRSGDIATLTKLLRVALLLPVVLLVALAFGWCGDGSAEGRSGAWRLPRVPLFLVGFVLLAGANIAGLVPTAAAGILSDISGWCLIAAVAAVGVRTSFRALWQVGPVAIGMLVAETLFLGLGALALVLILAP